MVRDQGYLIQWAQRQTGPSRKKGKREKSVRSTCAASDPFASRGARLVLRRPPWGIHVSCHSLCSKGQRCEGFKPWSATRNRDRRLDTGCRLLGSNQTAFSFSFSTSCRLRLQPLPILHAAVQKRVTASSGARSIPVVSYGSVTVFDM